MNQQEYRTIYPHKGTVVTFCDGEIFYCNIWTGSYVRGFSLKKRGGGLEFIGEKDIDTYRIQDYSVELCKEKKTSIETYLKLKGVLL